MNLFSKLALTVTLTLLFTLTLLSAPSPVLAQSPSNNWHYYGGVIGLYDAPDRVVYNVQDPYSGYTSRLECFYLEREGCDRVSLGHWVVVEGYTKGVAAGCFDGANNELHVVKMQVWNYVAGQWEVVEP